MSRAKCRGTRTRGVGEVVDDEPARGRVVDDERVKSHVTSRATCRGTRTRGGGEVVDDEPARGGLVDDEWRDEPRNVPRHPDARRRRSSRR
jgi:hypothetical protein